MKKIIEKLQKIFNIEMISKMVLIFIVLQPLFDILSFLKIRDYIPIGISTIVKPLFVFGVGIFIYLTNKNQRKSYSKIFVAYGILLIIHCLILKDILVTNSIILHEIRFMINIAYMLVLFMIMDFLYQNHPDREKFIKSLKKTLIVTFFIYCVSILLAIVTGTSGRTYEYADAIKEGFKGWLDSGQIFGHALSIALPFLIYYMLNIKNKNKIINVISKISIVIPIAVLLLIGTKVTYFIALLVLLSHFILDLIYFIKDKDKNNLISSIICLIVLIISLAVYNYLPVKKNIDINNSVLSEDMSASAEGSETNRADLLKMQQEISESEKNSNRTKSEEARINRIKNYYKWDYQTSLLLEKKYAKGEIHPSDLRERQLVYNWNKYKLSSVQYKLFGLGYLNQPEALSIERDLFMIIFSFGIIGFLTVLLKPILIWIKSALKIIKINIKLNLDTLYLFEGFSIFFCISLYAGYTFIYTNFSIFLVIIALLLRDSFKQYGSNKFSKYFDKIYKKNKTEFYNELEEKLTNDKKQFIITANPETIMYSEKNDELRNAVMDKDTLVVADGIGIVKGAKKLNYNINQTIPGIDIAVKLMELGSTYNKKIFLFGAKKEIIEKMKEVIKNKYNNLEIIGAVDGYVENKDKIFEDIKKCEPDIILVALGIPQQECLIYKHLNEFNKGIFVGVGGSFDVISGDKKRAPKIFIKLKLEWLYRILKEPKRLKRFFNSNIRYLLKIEEEKI